MVAIAYIGTYTQGASRGIYSLRYDAAIGKLTSIALAAQTISPSFLALHPNGRILYTVNESRRYNGIANSGSVSAFSIDFKTGGLRLLNTVASRGADPCHLTADRTGRRLFVANYNGGSVAVFPIKENGSLGEASQVVEHNGATKVDPAQGSPHPHSVNVSLDNTFLYVSDLGCDAIFVYNFDKTSGKLTLRSTAKLKPGSGPRHMAFSRDWRLLYVVSELSATVTTFQHDPATAALYEIQTISMLPEGFMGAKSGAEIAVDPSGRFLYASNRGSDSITPFAIDAQRGTLVAKGTSSSGGRTPRNFAIDPTGANIVAANQDSGNLVMFKIDPPTGVLSQAGEPLKIPDPVCVLFVLVP
jgi:6-phosphogluconolactonase